MAEQSNKAMYVLKYLWLNTDDDHTATTADIVKGTVKYGVSINRHAIPSIIKMLQDFGFDVIVTLGSPNRYFIGSRNFEFPELKLLVDAVESSRFISEKKSRELTEKLCAIASVHQANELNRHLYVEGRVKSDNKSLYYTVDTLHKAINSGKQIRFQYFEYTAEKKKIYKHGGYVYWFSPYALLWHNDCYYALGYSEKHKIITKFRVDRMDKAEITDTDAVTKPKNFDAVVYLKNIFAMYDGKMESIRLICDNDMMKVIIDRFGKDICTTPCKNGKFTADVEVSVSPTFFGWVFGFGGKIKILSPQRIVEGYIKAIQAETDRYKI